MFSEWDTLMALLGWNRPSIEAQYSGWRVLRTGYLYCVHNLEGWDVP